MSVLPLNSYNTFKHYTKSNTLLESLRSVNLRPKFITKIAIDHKAGIPLTYLFMRSKHLLEIKEEQETSAKTFDDLVKQLSENVQAMTNAHKKINAIIIAMSNITDKNTLQKTLQQHNLNYSSTVPSLTLRRRFYDN